MIFETSWSDKGGLDEGRSSAELAIGVLETIKGTTSDPGGCGFFGDLVRRLFWHSFFPMVQQKKSEWMKTKSNEETRRLRTRGK